MAEQSLTTKRLKLGLIHQKDIIRVALKEFLNKQENLEIVFESKSGNEMLAFLKNGRLRVDLLIIDVSVPIDNCVSVIKEIKLEAQSRIKLLALTDPLPKDIFDTMLQCGVDGFIPKSCSTSEFFDTIEFLLKNKQPFINHSEQGKTHQFDTHKALNQKEKMMLRLLCQQKTSHEIADELCLSIHSVNTYRTRLINELGVRNSIGLVIYAIENGIYIPEQLLF